MRTREALEPVPIRKAHPIAGWAERVATRVARHVDIVAAVLIVETLRGLGLG